MIGSSVGRRVFAYGGPVDMRKGFGAPGQAWWSRSWAGIGSRGIYTFS